VPTEKKLCKFLSRLENMGIYDDLRALAKERGRADLVEQLKNFQKNAKLIIPSLQYEIEIHKNRSKELQEQCDNLERKIELYAEQQSLFKLMRDDLDNYKKVAQLSKDLATYYSPFTPLHQYKREVLIKLPQIKSEIIDLKEAMKETSDNIDGLKKQIKELEAQKKELTDKNEVNVKKNLELNSRIGEMEQQMTEIAKKSFDEIPKLREKLERATDDKQQLEKKL
jgi:chromosome segregation ATPase